MHFFPECNQTAHRRAIGNDLGLSLAGLMVYDGLLLLGGLVCLGAFDAAPRRAILGEQCLLEVAVG